MPGGLPPSPSWSGPGSPSSPRKTLPSPTSSARWSLWAWGEVPLYARFLMAHLRLLQGEEATARAYLRKALEEAPLPALPYLAPPGVRLLGKEALPFLQAARPWAKEPLTQALLALAQGLYRGDGEGVAEALSLLLEEAAEEAMRGLLFLGRPHPSWESSPRGGRSSFGPQALGPTSRPWGSQGLAASPSPCARQSSLPSSSPGRRGGGGRTWPRPSTGRPTGPPSAWRSCA